MTFLNPGVLWGLLALAIPIIIHFFNLQRPKQILFSNVAFVREVKKTVTRRLKLRQWLLLAARLLALSLLILAFANPVVLHDGLRALNGARSVAIVIDNSYSMTAGNEKGPYLQQGLALARNIVNAYSRQDEFLVMPSSDLQLYANFGEQSDALDALRAVSTEQNTRSHGDILNFRKEIFSNASHPAQELYFISDFQKTTAGLDSPRVQLTDSSISVRYIPLATRAQNNVYANGAQIKSQILEKGKPVQMSLSLVNDGDSRVKEMGLRVLLDEKVSAIANQSLEPGSSAEMSLSFTPLGSGWISGRLELEDLPIDFDNTRYFSFYVPESERVLLAEGQASPNVRVLFSELFTQFRCTVIPARDLAGQQLSGYRSIVLSGITDISSGLAEKLQIYLEEGGSIMFMPGDNMNTESVNRFFNAIGAGSFEKQQQIPGGIRAGNVELDHPIFEGMFQGERRRAGFDAPMVYKYHPFKPGAARIFNPIISLDNSAPLFFESQTGKGLLFVLCSFPGDAWTDFHVKSSFAPSIYRATQIMNQTQNVVNSQQIGFYRPISFRSASKDIIRLVDSGEVALIPEQYSQGGATVINFDKLNLRAGNYRLMQGDSLLQMISFNAADRESRLDFLSAGALESALREAGYEGIGVLPNQADLIARQIEVEKEGIPLWKYFIIGALLFFIAEIFIIRIKNKPQPA